MKGSRLIVGGLAAALLLAVGLTGALAARQSADRTVAVATANSSLGQDRHAFGAGWYVASPAGKKVERDG